MNNDILELKRICDAISERLDLSKNQLSSFEKNRLIYLKNCLEERNRVLYMAYFDEDIFKSSEKKKNL